jgi:Raf kinase inhibitor-like YbhB/YbcL family protein
MTYDPYALAFPAPAFAVTSADFVDGGPLPRSAYQPADESPELSWGPLPAGTRSLVVTAFDADAPIPGGLWHWLVADIPAEAPGLPHGLADKSGIVLANSLGKRAYTGAKPPPGTGVHRMFFCVTALSVDTLVHMGEQSKGGLSADASAALLHIALIPHTLGRAIIVGTSE